MTEDLVLESIRKLGTNAYGLTVWQEVNRAVGRTVSLARLYLMCDDLEARGVLTSWEADPTPERGGRRKRYFKVIQTVEVTP